MILLHYDRETSETNALGRLLGVIGNIVRCEDEEESTINYKHVFQTLQPLMTHDDDYICKSSCWTIADCILNKKNTLVQLAIDMNIAHSAMHKLRRTAPESRVQACRVLINLLERGTNKQKQLCIFYHHHHHYHTCHIVDTRF